MPEAEIGDMEGNAFGGISVISMNRNFKYNAHNIEEENQPFVGELNKTQTWQGTTGDQEKP